jgi:hypothetical protein
LTPTFSNTRPAAQHRHDPAAAIIGAAGGADLEPHRGFAGGGGAQFQLFERRNDAVAQGSKPGCGSGLLGGEIVLEIGGHLGSLSLRFALPSIRRAKAQRCLIWHNAGQALIVGLVQP